MCQNFFEVRKEESAETALGIIPAFAKATSTLILSARPAAAAHQSAKLRAATKRAMETVAATATDVFVTRSVCALCSHICFSSFQMDVVDFCNASMTQI